MSPSLSLWQELLLACLASAALLYVAYFRIWLALAIGSDLLFVLALALAVASVTWPGLFAELADRTIDRSPVPSALAAADQKVAAIRSLPAELLRRALEKIGYEAEAATLPDEPEVDGPFVTHVRPSVEALLAGVLRVTGFVLGGFLMLTALAMRSSSTTARRLHGLAARVAELEARLGPLHATPSPASRPASRLPSRPGGDEA